MSEKLCENCPYNTPDMDGDVCSKCEESLNSLEKKLKAFEIIKEYFWLEDFQDFIAVNGRLPKCLEEECDALKEVLLWKV